MKNAQNATMEFEAKLNNLLLKIREAAENQFKYNLSTNIPKNIAGLNYDNAAGRALYDGVVHAVSHSYEWDTEQATNLAIHILEDSNVHDVVRAITKYLDGPGE